MIYRYQIYLVQLRAIHCKKIYLSMISVPSLICFSARIMVTTARDIKLDDRITIVKPASLALNAPKMAFSILNDQIITILTAHGLQHNVSNFCHSRNDNGLATIP